MKKFFAVLFLAGLMLMLIAPLAFGANGAAAAAATTASSGKLHYYALAVLGAEVGIGLAALGTGIGQGHAVGGACQGVARNPGVQGKILTTLIIGLAMIESLAIYALVIVLIVFYANPFHV